MYNFVEQIGHQITLQYVCRISFFTKQKFYIAPQNASTHDTYLPTF